MVIIALHRLLEVALEADVAVGEDADRPPVGGHHRQAGDLVPLHQLERGGQLLVGADGDGVDDHAGLGLLDLGDLQRLLGDGEVLVDDADAALARHADGGRGLGDRVHRRRDERDGQADARRQLRPDVDVLGKDVALGGNQQHVVERERFPQMTVRQHLGRLADRPPLRQGDRRSLSLRRRGLLRLAQVAAMASACCLGLGLDPGSALNVASSAFAPAQSPLATSAFMSS